MTAVAHTAMMVATLSITMTKRVGRGVRQKRALAFRLPYDIGA